MNNSFYLKKGLKAIHPWLYKNSITNISVLETASDGEPFSLYDFKGNFLAQGYVNKSEKIGGYIISDKPGNLEKIIIQHIHTALAKRAQERFARLIFAEGDSLPGIIADRYDQVLTLNLRNPGIYKYRDIILTTLGFKNVLINKYDGTTEEIGEIPAEVIVEENGLKFKCNLIHGQKTGYYFDQKENHLRFKKYSKDQAVLDAFCYVGGFGVHAVDAKEVVFLDSSAQALQYAASNAGSKVHQLIHGDAFEELTKMALANKKFGLISFDPPPFAKTKHDKPNALKAHYKLIELLAGLLEEGGVGFYSSCSYYISSHDLLAIVKKVFKGSFQLLGIYHQASDHPVIKNFKEGQYLNCLVLKKL